MTRVAYVYETWRQAVLAGCVFSLTLLLSTSDSQPRENVAANNTGVCATVQHNIVDVKAFGAKGDGSSDDSANVQAAVDCYISILENDGSHSGVLYFPPGAYLLRSPIRLVEPPKRGNDPSRWQGIVIRGAGRDKTSLVTDRPSGILTIEVPRLSGMVEIHSMRIASIAARGAAAIRVSAELNDRPVLGVRQKLDLFVHQVEIIGQDGGYFDYGIYTASIKRTIFDGVDVRNSVSEMPVASACYYMRDTYAPMLTNSECVGAGSGFVVVSQTEPRGESQGFFVTKSKFDRVGIAIDHGTHSSQPQGIIAKNVINASVKGVHLTNKKFVVIHDNEFHSSSRDAYVDIHFDEKLYRGRAKGNEKGIVRNNRFRSSSENSRRVGIKFSGTNRDMQVVSNVFERLGVGIELGEGSAGAVLVKNKFAGGRAVQDSGFATYRRD